MQNIGADNADDAFYRYKMPTLKAKIEGRGNGIKTNVVNNVDIAKALERPPEYIVKFFGYELGALTSYDSKTGTSIVNGAHDSQKLADLLEGFIKKYVQCYSCGNPETLIRVRKGCIHLKCKACGATSDVDMRHKLNNHILKNPPVEKLSKEEKKLKKQEKERLKSLETSKKDKKDKEKKKKDKKKDEEDGGPSKASGESSGAGDSTVPEPENGKESQRDGDDDNNDVVDVATAAADDDDDDDDVVWHTDTSEDAMKRRAEEQLSQAAAEMVVQGNYGAEKEESEKKEKKLLTKAGLKEDEINAVFEIRKLLKDCHSDKVSARLKDISGKPAVRMQIMFIALLGDTKKKLAVVVKENSTLLKTFSGSSTDQLAQLVALEHFTGLVAPGRVKECSQVLKVMYDLDLIEEELITAWYDRPAAGQQALGITADAARLVRDAAQPLVEWLKEAEDAEEEGEEEEEEEEED